MKILITGSSFENKGSQSMLFNIVDVLKKKYDNSIDILSLCYDNNKIVSEEKYGFKFLYGGIFAIREKIENRWMPSDSYYQMMLENEGSQFTVDDIHKTLEGLKSVDAIIDISGFALSSQFGRRVNERILWYIEFAKKKNIPIVFMPQSFGPFDYIGDAKYLYRSIAEILPKADLIMAREQYGADELLRNFSIKASVYPDLVLQNEIVYKNVIKTGFNISVPIPILRKQNKIGVIPNIRLCDRLPWEEVVSMYADFVRKGVSLGFHVYIFRHSNDLELCRKIYSEFNNSSVDLLEEDFQCYEYEEFIKQFDFLIASRYHAIVHAYKKNIPVVVVGWAKKYHELAANFCQREYVFDVNNVISNTLPVTDAIEKMSQKLYCEKEQLENSLKVIKEHNCFERCWEILDGE